MGPVELDEELAEPDAVLADADADAAVPAAEVEELLPHAAKPSAATTAVQTAIARTFALVFFIRGSFLLFSSSGNAPIPEARSSP